MKTTLTKQQIEWAKSHDWFIRDNGDGTIQCLEISTNKNGYPCCKEVTHNNFKALRDWAGY